MPYLVDRRCVLRLADIVAVVNAHQRGVRSRVVLRDTSLYRTLTRPATFLRYLARPQGEGRGAGRAKRPPQHGLVRIGSRRPRRPAGRRQRPQEAQ